MPGWGLLVIGTLIGTFGTLIGAGGGFILVPILMLVYPEKSADEITAISLAVVFFNAFSGSIAYARKKRIYYRAGMIFAAASIPGAIAGALTTQYLPRQLYDPIFSTVMIVIGVYLFFHPVPKIAVEESTSHEYSMPIGIGISVVVGFLSSLLGIGGGIIHVPAMIHFLAFAPHIATATSHFVLAIMALVGSAVHLYDGSLKSGEFEVLWIAPGVLVGAQIGAAISHKVNGKLIVRCLAVALTFVGLRILYTHFFL